MYTYTDKATRCVIGSFGGMGWVVEGWVGKWVVEWGCGSDQS